MPTSYWPGRKNGRAPKFPGLPGIPRAAGAGWLGRWARGSAARFGPVLDAQLVPVEGVEGVRHVARREHAGHARLEPLAHEDAVAGGESRLLGELRARRHADPDDHEVAVEGGSAGEPHPLHAAVALERLEARAEMQVHPVVPVDRRVDLAQLAPEDALERHLRHLDNCG